MRTIKRTKIFSKTFVISNSTHDTWNLLITGDRKGIALLWLHGFMGSAADWKPLVETYFLDFCNILVDLPGHGGSHLNSTSSFPERLNALMEQLQSEGIESFIPIGYSMGGRVAFHVQNSFPEKCMGLIILSGAPGLQTETERQKRVFADDNLMEKLRRVGFEAFLKEWYSLPLFDDIGANIDLQEHLITSRSDNQVDQLDMAIKLMGNGALPSLWKHLEQINHPILLVSGVNDSKYCSINTEMLAYLRKGRHKILSNAGHAFHLEKPLETAQTIRHFLSETIEGENSVSN